ncbi:putative ribosome biogenesis protein C8F11.04 isoform X2 [Impatiens glandulifera]|uniref:putative ribosome biogenesis protein C8F11.04 isoform X2 n=1 Tax=Impatiens glandulifera TaxID=253017 RepID=UPI001FB15242|nr:putative ribosome biogenesis protein C8F11.04 isoform X2 [Impatiens glandulifera]
MGVAEEILVHQPPSSAATSRVKSDIIQRAVTSLLKWKNSESRAQKPQLLEEDDFIYLVLTMKKIPPKDRTNAYKIPLPHSLRDSSAASEFCLIIDDRDRSKSRLTSEDAKKKVKAEDIPISKVLKVSKLKTDYRPFEAKRKLCDSYDMFFADRRVIPLLPKMIGKQFYRKKKIPVPIDLTHKNWKEQIERVCSSALLYMRTGTCCVLKVGKSSMEKEEIVENVQAAIDGVAEIVPKKWKGVRSFHLKFSESLALPIYQVMPDMLLKIEGVKRVEEEASIKEGSVIEVANEGDKIEKLSAQKDSDKKKSKGRIHDVQYMDTEEDEATEDLRKNDDEEEEVEEMEVEASGKKKRKHKDVKITPSKLKGGKKIKKLSDEATNVVEEQSVGKDSAAKKAKKKSPNLKDKKIKKKLSK